MKNKPLPWNWFGQLEDSSEVRLYSFYPKGEYRVLPESHAKMFRELCRRVIKGYDYTEYAKMVWKEVFEEKK